MRGKNRKFVAGPRLLTRVAFFLLFSLSLYFFMQSDFFALKKIEVKGNSLLSDEEVIRLTGLNKGENIWKIKSTEIKRLVQLHPIVGDVQVNRKLPGKIVIWVQEHRPAAVIPHAGGFLEVNPGGICLKTRKSIKNIKLPLITGILFQEAPKLGEKVNSPNLPYALRVVQNLPALMRPCFVEINVNNKDNIRLYMTGGVEVYLGNSENVEQKLDVLEKVRASLQEQGSWDDVSYVNVSFQGNPVVK